MPVIRSEGTLFQSPKTLLATLCGANSIVYKVVFNKRPRGQLSITSVKNKIMLSYRNKG
jgi:hypothetical protein